MWEIVKAELGYSRNGLFIFFAAIPLLVLLGVFSDVGTRSFVLWFVLILAVNHWNVKRISEKRDLQLARLPVSHRDLGRARALIIMLISLAYLVTYGLVAAVSGRPLGHGLHVLVFLWSIVVFGFSLVLMFRDRYVATKSLVRGKITLVFLSLAVLFYGIYAIIKVEHAGVAGAGAPLIVRATGYVLERDPLSSPVFIASFLAVALGLAYLSVVSFQHRRANTE